jgi:DNA polymerase III epsilon subunit family exonuclease
MAEAPTSGNLFGTAPTDPPLEDVRFAVVDVETTGLESDDRILEIAWILTRGREIEDEYEQLVNPDRPIPQEVVAIHGIREEAVREAPRFAEIAPRLERRLAGRVLVAHNAPFDVGFLRRELLRSGRRLPVLKVLDTLVLARNLHQDLERYNLDALAQELGLEHRPSHRALADVRTTVDLLWKLIDTCPRRPRTLKELLALMEPPEVSWEEAVAAGAVGPLLTPLRQGLESREPVRIAYEGRQGETVVQVRPLRLERSAGRIYLRATEQGDSRPKTYRLDRIHGVFREEDGA